MPRISRLEWERVKEVAGAAWALDAASRHAFVDESCRGNERLRDEVQSLLSAMTAVGERFETPALVSAEARNAAAAAVYPEPSLAAGSGVGGWRILRPLGEGGMGTVYLAERATADFQQQAALKVVRGVANPELVRRFHDERRILAGFDHPHIARLIDGGSTASGVPYVVMEYVDGVPIDVYCEQHKLSLRERLALFVQVCRAVHYAHQRLVVHRDIKASNLLVTADGTPKLLDFGIAKVLLGGSADLTQTLYRLVTPESASPEQIRGEPITMATDVYGLGVLLYRLLTGRGPYQVPAGSETQLTRAICEEPADPPSQHASGAGEGRVHLRIDRDLDRVVLMALRKEPERRYGTAEQLAEDLARYLEGRPVMAAPDSTAYRARKFAARHRVAVAATAGFAVALTLGLSAIIWQANIAREQRNRARQQFNAVRTLANSMLGELHDAMAPLQGSLPARELLVRRATEYLDALVPEAAEDRQLKREVALGYRRLAQVQGRGGFPNLGDSVNARAHFEKARVMLEALGEDTLDVEAGLALVEAHLALSQGDVDASVKQRRLAKAETILERWVAALPADPRVVGAAVAFWFSVGNRHEAARDYAAALDTFSKAARMAEGAVQRAPENPQASRDLSIIYKKMATESDFLGEHDAALAYYGKAMDLDAGRVKRDPARSLWRLDLSFSHSAIGNVLAKKGRLDESLEHYRQALTLQRGVVAEDPNDDFATVGLARGYAGYASVLGKSGDVDAAVRAQLDRVHVLERRRRAHADRINTWKDELSARVDAADSLFPLFAAAAMPNRASHRATTCSMLVRAGELPKEWSAAGQAGVVTAPASLNDLLQQCR